MRYLKIFLLALIMLAFAMPVIKAQTAASDTGTYNQSVNIYQASYTARGVLKSTDTTYTKPFNYPAEFDTTSSFFFLLTSASDSAKIKVSLQIYADSTWDTVRDFGIDSVETLVTWEPTATEIPRQYRLRLIGQTGNGYKTSYAIDWLFRRRFY